MNKEYLVHLETFDGADFFYKFNTKDEAINYLKYLYEGYLERYKDDGLIFAEDGNDSGSFISLGNWFPDEYYACIQLGRWINDDMYIFIKVEEISELDFTLH